jgi:cell wall-associated NlpC family hydrolase
MSYFDSEERQKKLKAILDEWAGTPFRHSCGIKGLGADCLQSVAEIMREVGVSSIPNKFPVYEKDWHLHRGQERILESLFNLGQSEEISFDESLLKNGDIIVFRYGRTYSHAGIYFDNLVHHVQDGAKFRSTTLNEPQIKNLKKKVFRIK